MADVLLIVPSGMSHGHLLVARPASHAALMKSTMKLICNLGDCLPRELLLQTQYFFMCPYLYHCLPVSCSHLIFSDSITPNLHLVRFLSFLLIPLSCGYGCRGAHARGTKDKAPLIDRNRSQRSYRRSKRHAESEEFLFQELTQCYISQS